MKLLKLLSTTYLVLFAYTLVASADTSGGLPCPLKEEYCTIPGALGGLLNVIVNVATPFIVLAVIWCGFLFVTARGNPEKISKAKDALWYTLVGTVLVIGATVLSDVLSSTITEITK